MVLTADEGYCKDEEERTKPSFVKSGSLNRRLTRTKTMDIRLRRTRKLQRLGDGDGDNRACMLI